MSSERLTPQQRARFASQLHEPHKRDWWVIANVVIAGLIVFVLGFKVGADWNERRHVKEQRDQWVKETIAK